VVIGANVHVQRAASAVGLDFQTNELAKRLLAKVGKALLQAAKLISTRGRITRVLSLERLNKAQIATSYTLSTVEP
jgi:hypothetical protein